MNQFFLFARLLLGSIVITQSLEHGVATVTLTIDKCTAIAVGPKGTQDGSTFNTHTADCAECDWRVNKIAAKDWPEGSQRPIFLISGAYPRQVREDRGATWSKANLEDLAQKSKWEDMEGSMIIGHIPQVAHTFAMVEGMYGIMNEHQVAIGESTCAAKLFAAPLTQGGKALLEISELSQIALERSKTAQEAIRIMGSLAEQYGYYSADWHTSTGSHAEDLAKAEGGEALTVTDPSEAWMFHILPDDTGTSAVWVAQRIPDDHISVVANSFVIKEVVPDCPEFMYSANLWTVATKMGWYSPSPIAGVQPLLNFAMTYAPPRYRYSYSNRRVGRVLSLANPGLNLPLESDTWADAYPFSVKVDLQSKRSDSTTTAEDGISESLGDMTVRRAVGAGGNNLLTAQDVMWIQRDHFEGTPSDLTKVFPTYVPIYLFTYLPAYLPT
jgi:dipeptidase